MGLDLSKLVDKTLDKVANNALSKVKNKFVSSITKKTDNPYAEAMTTVDKVSGIVPDEGANEASKRFDMYTTHTNRPKSSQQFYVLFEPRPAQDLIYQNIIAGTPGTPSGLLSDLKRAGKSLLKAGLNGLKSLIPEFGKGGSGWDWPDWMKFGGGSGSSWFSSFKFPSISMPDWMKDISIGSWFKDIKFPSLGIDWPDFNGFFKGWGIDLKGLGINLSDLKKFFHISGGKLDIDFSGLKAFFRGFNIELPDGMFDGLKDLFKGVKLPSFNFDFDFSTASWSGTIGYIFGTSGTPDRVVLYQPVPYNAMGSGWLSSFASRLDERARVVEWGLFSPEDSYDSLVNYCNEISMHVLDVTRPSWEIPVTRYNQYNRDRLVYEKVKYDPITMTFYDTIDSALIKLLLFQLAFINDSYIKTFGHFTEYTQLENFLNNPQNWGMNLFSNTGIFQAISIVEVFGDQCTVYNLMMPKITKVQLSKADASQSGVHKITITFEYEGMTNYNPLTLNKNDYDIMLAWAMSDSSKAAAIAQACRMRYQSSLQAIANLSKDFFVDDGSIKSKLLNLGQKAGFGSEIKLVNEIQEAIKSGKTGGLVKQLVNPSSITSKIKRLF